MQRRRIPAFGGGQCFFVPTIRKPRSQDNAKSNIWKMNPLMESRWIDRISGTARDGRTTAWRATGLGGLKGSIFTTKGKKGLVEDSNGWI